MAVGGGKALRWDGTAWTSVPFAPFPSSTSAFLFAVACASATSCVAVGSKSTNFSQVSGTAVESWDGTQWTAVASPSPAGVSSSALVNVTCTSASFCAAVGQTYDSGSSDPSFIEQWDGASWSIVASPPEATTDPGLLDVSCSSETTCAAVGGYQLASGSGTPLVEAYDGDGWSLVASPPIDDPGFHALQGVSCSSLTNCFAVGSTDLNSTDSRGFVERFDGTSWSMVSAPNLGAGVTSLHSLTCASDASCFAIADRGKTAQAVEHWNGSSWAPTAKAPIDPAPSDARLVAVACATATKCFAVGNHTTTAHNNPPFSFIERSAGSTWSVDVSRERGGVSTSRLSGVACPGPKVCFAVGTWSAYGAAMTFVERWNGTAWSLVTSPNVGRETKPVTANRLTGVSCTSPTNCFAVGTSTYTTTTGVATASTLIEHWDGQAWTIVRSPNRTGVGANMLEGVSCPSPSSCFAVGRTSKDFYGPSSTYKTLTLHWNGASWSIVPSPNAANGAGELAGVSCVSDRACVAVGDAYRFAVQQSLIDTWNGTTWTRVPNADPVSATHSALTGVSCTSPASCVAVGTASGTSKLTSTLTKVSAGGHWSIVPGANVPGAVNSSLNAVVCGSAASCVAVGSYDTNGGPLTLLERYS